MKNIAIALIALAVSFAAGWWASSTLHDNRQMKNQIAGQQQDEKDVATNIELRQDADERQQVSIREYQDGKKSDTIRTEALLDRVLNHFDRMQQPAGTEKAEVADPATPIPAELRETKPVNFLDNYEAHLKSMGVKLGGLMRIPGSLISVSLT